MLRRVFLLSMLMFLVPLLPLLGEEVKTVRLHPKEFEVGQVGWLNTDPAGRGQPYRITIIEIIDETSMRMQLGLNEPQFIVKGQSTKGLVEDKAIELPGLWKITGTVKHGGKTYYVLEPTK